MRGPIPRLDTVHEVERILHRAWKGDEDPLPLAEIKRRMEARSVRHSTVRSCVEELKRRGLVMEGSKGVFWTLNEDPAFWSTPTIQLYPVDESKAFFARRKKTAGNVQGTSTVRKRRGTARRNRPKGR